MWDRGHYKYCSVKMARFCLLFWTFQELTVTRYAFSIAWSFTVCYSPPLIKRAQQVLQSKFGRLTHILSPIHLSWQKNADEHKKFIFYYYRLIWMCVCGWSGAMKRPFFITDTFIFRRFPLFAWARKRDGGECLNSNLAGTSSIAATVVSIAIEIERDES